MPVPVDVVPVGRGTRARPVPEYRLAPLCKCSYGTALDETHAE